MSGGSIALCVDPHPFSRQVGTGAELFELSEEGFVDRLVGHGDGAEDVALCWCVVGDGEFAGGLEEHVDDGALGGRQQYVVDEGVSLVAAAVAADQLHPGTWDGDVEQPGVGGVREVEAHDLTGAGGEFEIGLTAGEHHVAEAAHGDEVRAVEVVGGDVAVLEENIVEGDDELTVDGRPVVRVGGFDDEVAVEAHVEAVVLADVGVVPVQAGVGEAHLIGEVAADGDRVLGLIRHAVVVVVETQSVPMHGRLGVGVVTNANRDLRSLTHAQRRAGDRPVVGKHPNSVLPDLLDDRCDPEFEGVTSGEVDERRGDALVQAGNVG